MILLWTAAVLAADLKSESALLDRCTGGDSDACVEAAQVLRLRWAQETVRGLRGEPREDAAFDASPLAGLADRLLAGACAAGATAACPEPGRPLSQLRASGIALRLGHVPVVVAADGIWYADDGRPAHMPWAAGEQHEVKAAGTAGNSLLIVRGLGRALVADEPWPVLRVAGRTAVLPLLPPAGTAWVDVSSIGEDGQVLGEVFPCPWEENACPALGAPGGGPALLFPKLGLRMSERESYEGWQLLRRGTRIVAANNQGIVLADLDGTRETRIESTAIQGMYNALLGPDGAVIAGGEPLRRWDGDAEPSGILARANPVALEGDDVWVEEKRGALVLIDSEGRRLAAMDGLAWRPDGDASPLLRRLPTARAPGWLTRLHEITLPGVSEVPVAASGPITVRGLMVGWSLPVLHLLGPDGVTRDVQPDDSEFRFDGVPPGEWRVTEEGHEGVAFLYDLPDDGQISLRPGEDDCWVTRPRDEPAEAWVGATLEARPITRAEATAMHLAGLGHGIVTARASFEDGRARLPLPDDLRWSVFTVRLKDGRVGTALGEACPREIPAGTGLVNRVRILDAHRVPVAGAAVTWHGATGGPLPLGRTGTDGDVAVPGFALATLQGLSLDPGATPSGDHVSIQNAHGDLDGDVLVVVAPTRAWGTVPLPEVSGALRIGQDTQATAGGTAEVLLGESPAPATFAGARTWTATLGLGTAPQWVRSTIPCSGSSTPTARRPRTSR